MYLTLSFFSFFSFLVPYSSFYSYFGVMYSQRYLPNFTTMNTTTSQ